MRLSLPEQTSSSCQNLLLLLACAPSLSPSAFVESLEKRSSRPLALIVWPPSSAPFSSASGRRMEWNQSHGQSKSLWIWRRRIAVLWCGKMTLKMLSTASAAMQSGRRYSCIFLSCCPSSISATAAKASCVSGATIFSSGFGHSRARAHNRATHSGPFSSALLFSRFCVAFIITSPSSPVQRSWTTSPCTATTRKCAAQLSSSSRRCTASTSKPT